jgi:hypothetical protein
MTVLLAVAIGALVDLRVVAALLLLTAAAAAVTVDIASGVDRSTIISDVKCSIQT